MKNTSRGVIAAAFLAGAAPAFAQMTIPNTFTPGTPARAAEVNANFSAVKTAVDGKQARVSGTCASGSAVRTIAADGSVTCQAAVTSVSATGTGNPVTVQSGTTTPTLAFKTCSAGQALLYDATSGWTCKFVQPIVATAAGCGLNCGTIDAGDFTTTITVNSITITTPAAGTVDVRYTGGIECSLSANQAIVMFGRITDTNTGGIVGYADGGAMFRVNQNTVSTGSYDGNMSAHRTFTVSGAGTHTYYYRANNWDANVTPAYCKFYGGNMTAIYYP